MAKQLKDIFRAVDNGFDRSQQDPIPDVSSLLITLSSRVGGGKTTLLLNLLNSKVEQCTLRKKFDTIWLCSSTADGADPKMKKLYRETQQDNQFSDRFDPEFLMRMDETITKMNQDDATARHLLICDDVITEMGKSDSSVFAALVTRCRHKRLSIVVTTQRYMRLPPIWRANQTILCTFPSTNAKEIETMENDVGISRAVFRRLYTECCSKSAHSFMWIQMLCMPPVVYNDRFERLDAPDIMVV